MDRKISTRYYNNRTVYDYLNIIFPYYCGIPYLNLPPISIDDRPHLHKRARYTPYLIPVAIYVASENYVSTFTNPYNFPQLILLPSDDYNPTHERKKYEPYRDRLKRGYCCRKHDEKICYKKTRFYCSTCFDKDKKIYYCHGFYSISPERNNCFIQHHNCMEQIFS